MSRIDPDWAGASERVALAQWLDYHRATIIVKVEGLDEHQVRQRVVPSETNLIGLVRHLAEVERNWAKRVFAGLDAPPLYWGDHDPDGDFHPRDDETLEEAVAVYLVECAEADAIYAAAGSLDQIAAVKPSWAPATPDLRWIYLHLIEETARHNGHADIIRELIDGVTGD